MKPSYHHATKVIHNSVEGEEDSIEVFTPNSWLFIAIENAEVVHKDYLSRSEGIPRWYSKKK